MIVEIVRTGKERDVAPMILSQLSRLDRAIEKEFTLVSDRMAWMVVSEAFIFGAFVDAAVNYTPSATYLKNLIVALLLTLPLLGITMAGFAWRAIIAAHGAVARLKDKREELEKHFPEPIRVDLISSKQHVHEMGNAPPRYLPPIIIFIWLAFLIIAAMELAQTIAGRVTTAVLAILFCAVLFLVRSAFVRRITELEMQVRELKANAAPK